MKFNNIHTHLAPDLENTAENTSTEGRTYGWAHLCIITVDVVEDPDEDVSCNVVQSHHRDAGLCL